MAIDEPARDRSIQRASDADREDAVELLRSAAGEGRLGLDEFEERMSAAYRARTYGELAPITADLPHDLTTSAPQELNLRVTGAKLRREGRWAVPRRIDVEAKAAAVRLDFTAATLLSTDVEVALHTTASKVEILVPHQASVDADGLESRWAKADVKAGETTPARLRLRITGSNELGTVKVRHPWIWDVWARKLGAWWRRTVTARS